MDITPRPRSERSLVDVIEALSRGSTRYEQEGELARGGMGSIHRVWDRDLQRPLAMKRYLGDVEVRRESVTDSTVGPRIARFVEEAQIMGQLDHPGVVPVHEIGLDESGQLFFTMRLVEGHTLGEVFRLAREGSDRWTPTRVLRALVRVCEAVAYAHSRGVIHRDLKPANVMVGQFGEVYVMDWGLAKILGTEERRAKPREAPPVRSQRAEEASTAADSHLLTMEGNVLGTPAYMPPEQARGRLQDVGPRADVYALGAILYEFLTGRAPYSGEPGTETAYEVLKAVLEGPPAPVRELCPDAPPELVQICEQAMARDPEERFASSLDLAEALSSFFERPVTQARLGLQRSRLVTTTQWALGFAFWSLLAVLVTLIALLGLTDADSGVSLSVPFSFDVETPGYTLGSEHSWIQGVNLEDTRGHLIVQSNHWAAQAGILSGVAILLLFLLYVLHQARWILRAVRRGEPFAEDNLRRIRRIAVAILVLGILHMAYPPLIGSFAERYLVTEGLRIRSEVELPWLEGLGAALVFILAEVFRVGMELERRTG